MTAGPGRFAGKVVELGRKHGIATPANSLIYATLKPHVNGPPENLRR